ncbi:MAG: monofunctional biosynthetic peptidoglycan transglycosylase [Bacteroidia bacterium]
MLQRISRILLKIMLWYIILSIATVIVYRFVPPPVTPLMIIRLFEQKSDGKEMRLKKDWMALSGISASLPLAVITSEDQKFEEHFGFDLEAIEKAGKYNKRHNGKKVKGASTISQQTAKNVFLTQSRTWVRKGFEVYFTFLIEVFWSKERIMEIYLNEIEMGDGIYGAEAAAQKYFHKPAKKLNNSEAALIAACLPNPRKWSPAKPTPYIMRKKDWILRHMSMMEAKDF